eukprot:2626187-Pyramimonas_sp.AAC.2
MVSALHPALACLYIETVAALSNLVVPVTKFTPQRVGRKMEGRGSSGRPSAPPGKAIEPCGKCLTT